MQVAIKQFFHYYFWAVVLFLFMILLTAGIFWYLRDRVHRRNQAMFRMVSSQAEERISRRFDHYIQILRGGKGLFLASDTITRQDWQQYIQAVQVQQTFPGIQGVGYAEAVVANQRTTHEKRIQAEGFPEYQIKPAGFRNFYTPIIFLEPFTGRNLRAFGFDMFSEPRRRQAMEQARDTGRPVLTDKVQLVQETDQAVQPGFLIYLPVYRGEVLPVTVAERRRRLKGFVYSPFRAYDLMQNLLRHSYDHINIQIYDGPTVSPENLLFDKALYAPNELILPADFRPRFRHRRRVHFADQTWTLQFSTYPAFNESESTLPGLVLAAGLLISTLIFVALCFFISTRRSNQLKQIITDNATAALFMMDASGYCTFMNPAAARMTGYSMEEIRQKPLHDLIHHHRPDGSLYPLAECPIDRALPTNNSMRAHEDTFFRKDGTAFQVSCAASPIFHQDMPVATVIEVRDITEERRARIAMAESEQRFRNMADHAPVMIWITDEAGQAIYLNKQWLQFTGQTEGEALGVGWRQALFAEDVDNVHDLYRDAFKRRVGFSMDYRLCRHDGVYRWVATTATPRLNAAGDFLGYIGSITDITERKEAERRLKENADLLHRIFLEVPAIVALIRASDQVYILANPHYSRLHGDRPLLGKRIREANPDLEGQGFFQIIGRVIDTGQPFTGKEVAVTIQNKDQARKGYFNLVFQPLFTNNNQVAAVLLFAVEVTELVEGRQKLQQTNEALTQTNQELRRSNTDLDNFVYTASHDLKAPLANLEGLTNDLQYSLQDRLEPDETRLMEMLAGAINKLKRTIVDLTEITKVQKDIEATVDTISFAEVFEDVASDLQGLIREAGASIQTDWGVTHLTFARKNLRSILYNLLSNALKYRAPDKLLEINITTVQEGDFVHFTMQDNGLGIRADQHHKLFTMFKRVHTHVEGSGIGLYIIKRIIENHGGRIALESEAGEGATFHIFFPGT